MSDWPKRSPDVPEGWVAIPKSALLRLTGQAASSETEMRSVRDPDAYKHYRTTRMFQDMAVDLQARHEPFLKTVDLGGGIVGTRAEVMLIDPAYMDHRHRTFAERHRPVEPMPLVSQSDVAVPTAMAMRPTAATPKPKPEGTNEAETDQNRQGQDQR